MSEAATHGKRGGKRNVANQLSAHRLQTHGFAGLKDLPPVHNSHPQTTVERRRRRLWKNSTRVSASVIWRAWRRALPVAAVCLVCCALIREVHADSGRLAFFESGRPSVAGEGPAPYAERRSLPNLSGSYDIVTGINPDGSRYEGTVVIVKNRQGKARYCLAWTIGKQQEQGCGNLEAKLGERAVLTVDWGSEYPVIYEVLRDGRTLRGKWGNGAGTENLERRQTP